jgi:hypothetical protein
MSFKIGIVAAGGALGSDLSSGHNRRFPALYKVLKQAIDSNEIRTCRARAQSSGSSLQLHLRPKSVDILRQHVMGDLEPANQWILYQRRERRLWRVF